MLMTEPVVAKRAQNTAMQGTHANRQITSKVIKHEFGNKYKQLQHD